MTGTFSANLPTRGNLGNFTQANKPSFMSYGLTWDGSFTDWGWVYETENNGTWINSATGHSGDITG